MGELTLRAYLQEVDDLIEHEQLDEAIAHSRHILQIYPKHLETYRLLGKSYLEAKRYGDAADLFQRVLSAIPDDFVAHIGMSIVREDEGNLDAAIWHMERAFETNPANPAIQQELRRLIGRRDGLEPHKVRLTRGALARMYAHGELYPQAIAELRSALQEDADRPDLQTLLAEMYWRTEQKTEAADVCTRLLEKLPYCRDALRILAAALHAAGQVDEAAVYHRRLASLDPYAAFLDTAIGDSKTVDAGAVKIEKLAWHPGQPLPAGEGGRPQWSTTSTSAPPAPSPVAVPGWLSALEEPAAPAVPAPVEPEPETGQTVHPFAGAKPPEVQDIPQWMRQGGWAESQGQAVESPVSFSDSEMQNLDSGAPAVQGNTGELQPADIPPWLQQMAPSGGTRYPSEPSTRPSSSGPSDLPDWLGEFAAEDQPAAQPSSPPAAAAVSASAAPESEATGGGLFDEAEAPSVPPAAEPSAAERVPTWLQTPADGATETIVTWLGRKDVPSETPEVQPAAEPPPPSEGTPAPEEDIPSWVGRMQSLDSAAAAPQPSPETEGLPSWLSGVAEAASQEESLTPADFQAILPETTPLPGAEFEEEASPPLAKGEAPDWLKALAGPESEGDPAAKEIDSAAESTQLPPPPDWMTGVPSADAGSRGLPREDATPAWMKGIDADRSKLAPAESSQEGEPEWLRGIAEPETGPSPAPDWMRGIAEAAAAAATDEAGEAEPGADAAVPASPVPDKPVSAAEETIVSMRALAAEPPSETSEPGGPTTEPPDWLREFASPAEAEAVPDAVPTGEVPSWVRDLRDSSTGPGEESTSEDVAPAEFQGALDWLQASASEVSPDPTQAPTAPPSQPTSTQVPGAAEPVSDDEVFQWLEDLAARQGEPETSADAEAPGVGATIAPTQPGPSEPAIESVGAGEDLDWLDRISSGEDVAEPESDAVAPQPGSDEEWLREMAAAPSPALPTDLWDKLDTEETIASRRTEQAAAETAQASGRPAPDDTLPGSNRPGLAAPRRPIEESPRPPQTTPLTEGEVVEWLRQTASGNRPGSALPEPEPAEEADIIPQAADQATALAIQLIQAARTAMTEGDVNAALGAYTPVIDRGLLLNSVIEDLRKAVDLRPDATAIWQSLGEAYKKANMLPEAIKAFSRAMKQEDGLEMARQALAEGDFTQAIMHYGGLIKKKRNLESVIEDLRGVLDREPRRPPLWQALGDAYMKVNRLPEAIEAYRRGMDAV